MVKLFEPKRKAALTWCGVILKCPSIHFILPKPLHNGSHFNIDNNLEVVLNNARESVECVQWISDFENPLDHKAYCYSILQQVQLIAPAQQSTWLHMSL